MGTLGFVVTVILFILPVINHLIGGFLAGIIARGELGRRQSRIPCRGSRRHDSRNIPGPGTVIFSGGSGSPGVGLAAIPVILALYSGIPGLIGG